MQAPLLPRVSRCAHNAEVPFGGLFGHGRCNVLVFGTRSHCNAHVESPIERVVLESADVTERLIASRRAGFEQRLGLPKDDLGLERGADQPEAAQDPAVALFTEPDAPVVRVEGPRYFERLAYAVAVAVVIYVLVSLLRAHHEDDGALSGMPASRVLAAAEASGELR